ncbi:MAG: LacI family transcriptional regulator [Lachnospiraceae bacterium]|nr:LacI family transcriptional regulator [Lachnospiraceae bacterium]
MNIIHEIANLAGVSVPTVYKVFSDTYTTGEAIQEKVLQAAKELHYTPKTKSSPLKQKEKIVAVILSEVMNPFINSLIDAITKELNNFQYKVIVLYSNENVRMEESNLSLLSMLQIDALIYGPISGNRYPQIDELIKEGKPVIQLFSPVYEQLDTIMFDDAHGTYQAVKKLLQSGHKKIMMIYRKRPIMPSREPGYYKAFKETGLEVNPDFLFSLDVQDSIKGMIKDKVKELKPTAILSANESISIATIQALDELNLKVPSDVSMILYDDSPWEATMGYTAVAHPLEQVGTLCRNLIMKENGNKSQGRQAPAKLVIDPMIISRNSVRIVQ